MDPGNWATDIAAGSQFAYTLLSVVVVSSLMAILLQHLALKLGVATGRDLAQACRDHFHPVVSFTLWVGCEIAIAACDLAEVIGSAIALNLLFGLPLIWGVCLTAFDVLAVLYLQNKGFRLIEALVVALIGVIAVSFGIQVFLSKPEFGAMALGCVPSPEILRNPAMLYAAIGILGATVMPHNLYLHSSIAQTWHFELTPKGKREAIFFGTVDSTLALFFLHLRLHPVLRRLITRLVAIVPAIIVTALMGESGVARLIILSQVILSLQLSFAVIPLVMFTGDKRKMREFVNPR